MPAKRVKVNTYFRGVPILPQWARFLHPPIWAGPGEEGTSGRLTRAPSLETQGQSRGADGKLERGENDGGGRRGGAKGREGGKTAFLHSPFLSAPSPRSPSFPARPTTCPWVSQDARALVLAVRSAHAHITVDVTCIAQLWLVVLATYQPYQIMSSLLCFSNQTPLSCDGSVMAAGSALWKLIRILILKDRI